MAAARLRKQTKKREWTERGIDFSDAFREETSGLLRRCRSCGEEGDESAAAAELVAFTRIGTTYAEREAWPGTWRAIDRAVRAGSSGDSAAVDVLGLAVAILFEGNSKPLHRQILASVAKLDGASFALCEASIQRSLRTCFASAPSESAVTAGPPHRDLVRATEALGSLLGHRRFDGVLAACAAEALTALSSALRGVCALASGPPSDAGLPPEGPARPLPPSHAAFCQDALGVLYGLAQPRRGGRGRERANEGPSALGTPAPAAAPTCVACLACLAVEAMPRDAMITAAVTLWTLLFRDAAQEAEGGEGDDGAGDAPAVWAVQCLFGRGGAVVFALPGEVGPSGGGAGMDRGPLAGALRARGVAIAPAMASLSRFGRSCCLRGLLSVLPPRCFGACLEVQAGSGGSGGSGGRGTRWLLMAEGLLPMIREAIEGAEDAHIKYHALCTLETCLLQWRKCMLMRLDAREAPLDGDEGGGAEGAALFDAPETDATEDDGRGVPPGNAGVWGGEGAKDGLLDEACLGGLIALLHTNWEDPMAQIAKSCQSCFGVVLEVADVQARLRGGDARAFYVRLARGLFAQGYHKKGTYAGLGHLTTKLGARGVLAVSGTVIDETVSAARHESVFPAAAALFKALVGKLHEELGSLDAWMGVWVAPIAAALKSPDPSLRFNVSHTMLRVPLEKEPLCLGGLLTGMLGAMGDPARPEEVGAVVAVLKAAKDLNLVGELELALPCPGGARVHLPPRLFQEAIASRVESVRIDVLELMCGGHKQIVLPGALNLSLLRQAIPMNLRCSIPGFKQRFATLMRKFFTRIHVAMRNIKHRHATDRRWLAKQPRHASAQGEGAANDPGDPVRASEIEAIDASASFLAWLEDYLVCCAYPGAPFSRKSLALDLLLVLLQTFLSEPTEEARMHRYATWSPWQGRLHTEGMVRCLLACVDDSWDDIRAAASRVLCEFPAPLPGLQEAPQVTAVLAWAKSLLESARVRECDTGAWLVRILFKKYVVALGWGISLHPLRVEAGSRGMADGDTPPTPALPPAPEEQTAKALALLRSAMGMIGACIADGRKDLRGACLSGLAHGSLLVVRYLVEDMRAMRLIPPPALTPLMSDLYALISEATQVAVWAVSQQDELSIQASDAGGGWGGGPFPEEGQEEEASDVAPEAQIIVNGSWLTIKEIGMLSGAMAAILVDGLGPRLPPPVMADGDASPVVRLVQALGDNLVWILERVKHNGAVEKVHGGLMRLIKPLLMHESEALSGMPLGWLKRIERYAMRPNQTLSDIVRRSAGLPFAFLSIIKAEPRGLPKRLLPYGMETALAIAGGAPPGAGASASPPSVPSRVHALNMLCKAFNDSELATDTSRYYGCGLELAIRGLGSSRWEVRNGAGQLFSALVVRVVGFKNQWKRQTSRRAITSKEFFDRFRGTHAFFRKELRAAVADLEAAQADGRHRRVRAATLVHPSLLPILIVLSRLRGSMDNTYTGSVDAFSPTLLAPLVQACGVAHAMALRNLAAHALCPLVAPDELQAQVLSLLQSINARVGEGGSIPSGKANAVHGALRQVACLVTKNAAAALDHAGRHALLGAAADASGGVVRCAGAGVSCPFVRAEATAVLVAFLSLASAPPAVGSSVESKDLSPWLERVANIAKEERFCAGEGGEGAGGQGAVGEYARQVAVVRALVPWARAAAASSSSSSSSCSCSVPPALCAALVRALSCPHYEVRAAALKAIAKHWDLLAGKGKGKGKGNGQGEGAKEKEGEAIDGDGSHGDRKALLSILVGRVGRETHPKAMRRLLAALQSLSTEVGAAPGMAAASRELPAVCLAVFETASDIPLRCQALSCAGHYLATLLSQGSSVRPFPPPSHDLVAALGGVVDAAGRCAQPSQRSAFRHAAHAALIASGVLRALCHAVEAQPQPKGGLSPSLSAGAGEGKGQGQGEGQGKGEGEGEKEGEGEEEGERKGEGEGEGEGCVRGWHFAAWRVAVLLMEDEEDDLRGRVGEEVAGCLRSSLACYLGTGASPFLLLEGVLAHVAYHHPTHPPLRNWLKTTLVPEGGGGGGGGGAGARLFDTEGDNLHEEPLLRAQLAARELGRMGRGGRGGKGGEGGEGIADAIAQACDAVRKARGSSLRSVAVGVANDPRAFVSLYALVLGARAFGLERSQGEAPLCRVLSEGGACPLPPALHALLEDHTDENQALFLTQ